MSISQVITAQDTIILAPSESTPRTTFAAKIVTSGLILTAVALVLLLFAFAVGLGDDHDDEQYVTAGVLAMHSRIYRDFIYLQTPLYPELLAGVFNSLTNGSGYFLVARLLNWACTIVTCALLWGVGWRITGRHAIGFGTALLFAVSPEVIPGIASARNDMVSCAAAMAAMALVLSAIRQHRFTNILMALAGFGFALAVGLKLIYAFVPAGVMVYVLAADLDRPFRQRLVEMALPLALGGAAGGMILLGYGTGAWTAFLYENYTYHREAPFLWGQRTGDHSSFEASYAVKFVLGQVFKDTTLVIVILTVVTVVTMLTTKAKLQIRRQLSNDGAPLVLFLVGLALLFGFLPRPPHIQYFQPFGLFMALSVPFLYTALAPLGQVRLALFGGMILIGCLPGFRLLLQNGSHALDSKNWIVTRVQVASQDIRKRIEARGVSGPILTLSPIFALDAGLPIYRELSAGPFFFRTADHLSTATVESLHGVSPATLDALLQRRPPSAVLVGKEPAFLEQPLIDFAERRGFEETTVTGFPKLRLFIRRGPLG
jgi:hypothetical protein